MLGAFGDCTSLCSGEHAKIIKENKNKVALIDNLVQKISNNISIIQLKKNRNS